jgi:ATP-binding cassette subfamily C (CFTR/MRP) protein 1
VIGITSSLFSVGAVVILKLYCGLRSSRHLHDQAFKALMRSPLSFFELTPTGRILNLFSRDVFVIDEVMVMALAGFVRTVSGY